MYYYLQILRCSTLHSSYQRTLDVVCTRNDLSSPTVDVIDIGLSDHCLLCWSSSLLRPQPVYATSTRTSWRLLDLDTFQTDLRASALCDDQLWAGLDGDGLVKLYDDTVYSIDRFHYGPLPFAVDRPTRGTTTAVQPSGQYTLQSVPLVELGRCLTSRYQRC